MGLFNWKKPKQDLFSAPLEKAEQDLFSAFWGIAKTQLVPTKIALSGLDENLIEEQKLICYIYYDTLASAVIDNTFKPERKRDLMRALARDSALNELEKDGFAQYRTYHNKKETFETAPLVQADFLEALERDKERANKFMEGASSAVSTTLSYLDEGSSEKLAFDLTIFIMTMTNKEISG